MAMMQQTDDVILSAPVDPAEALKLYGEHFSENAQQSLFELSPTSYANFASCAPNKASPKMDDRQDCQMHAELVMALGLSRQQAHGEELCYHCNLPLGNSFYKSEDEKCIHGECLAQTMVRDMQKEDKARQERERKQKMKRHEEYGIGWNVEHIPRNDVAAKKLTMLDVPQGMVCIALDETTKSIGLASTLEPAAALNLEYLSTALEVRRKEGHEPVFSLDPVSSEMNAMQEKKFMPEWLAGTAAGDVLFQADYHLKELSMGEHDQPVVGMKSCIDYSLQEQVHLEWRAREWFMVRKAEVQISENNVLYPYVKMGVEAREQVIKDDSMQDKQITRPDHPMVMYAEAFTKNFDLIAERKSVVYHLRELAKASVIAKYLLDTHVQLDDGWFNLASGKEVPCSLEVPQLWNERIFAKVNVEGGVLKNEQDSHMHGVYGGVQFGLDKFSLATSISRAPGASVVAGMPKHRLAFGLSQRAGLAPVSNIMSMASGAQFKPPSAAISASALTGAPRLATSIGVSPLRAGLAPPSAALSATIAPRLATSVSASIAAVPRLSTSAAATIGMAPRLATSIGASIGAAPRLATSVMPPQRLAAQISAASRPLLATSIGAAPPRLAASISASIGGAPRLGANLSASMGLAPPRLGANLSASIGAVPGRLQGVDLRLDNFDLSEAKHVSRETQEGSWGGELKSLEECVAMGSTFWLSLESDGEILKKEDKSLLRKVFNSKLSDRRSEGDLFAPPDASHTYVTKLRALVKEEESVRQRRKANFFAKAFAVDEPGPLFPSSWKSSFESNAQRPQTTLVPRPEYKEEQSVELLQDTLRTSSPIFDKTTEEGLRFRIYSLGSLEVRTIQEVDGDEVVGSVFSVQKSQELDNEKVFKALQYVESKKIPFMPKRR